MAFIVSFLISYDDYDLFLWKIPINDWNGQKLSIIIWTIFSAVSSMKVSINTNNVNI